MATTMDTQITQQDDLGHDTLMGLQELDSHLSIFESTETGLDTSTPGAVSPPGFDTAIDTIEDSSNTIVVESPIEYQHSDIKPRAKPNETKPGFNATNKISRQTNYSSDGHVHLKPESARDSLASSMTTDQDDASSGLSSLSSNPTSPTDFDNQSREATKASSIDGNRQKYNVRPKESIPPELHPAEYARQCIAAAESSRLNPYSLHPEEYQLLRRHISHQQVTTYLNIRNGILRLWVRNPTIHVMRNEAIGCAKDARWFEVARICHEWLARRGYINYGCLENPESTKDKSKKPKAKRKRRTIAVLGAGMSGLGCARQLEGLFAQFEDRFHEMDEELPRVIILEGRDRIGGRVYSRQFKTRPKYPTLYPGSRHTAEMGGMIITGFDRGNPLNIIVRRQLALPYHPLRPDTTIYDSNGQPVDLQRDQQAEKLFNYILDRVSEYKFKLPVSPLIDGDKDHLDAGRDGNGDGSRTISEVESRTSIPAQSTTSENAPGSVEIQMVPVSSDRLTGRAHLEAGIPAVHTAAYKAREIGWKLREGVGIEFDLDLERATNAQDATLGSVFDDAIRQYMRIIDFTPLDLRLINWHVANLEYSNAITYSKLSLGGWDLDAGNEWEGKHSMVIGGYQQVPRGLLNCPSPLDVRKGHAAKRIIYKDSIQKSVIECENGEAIEADYIVSTIPLGVLKQKKIQFEPALPDWKTGAIRRIGYGVLNKIVLVYKEPFWDLSRDIFGTLRSPPNRFTLDQGEYFTQRGRFFQWFNCTETSGLPTLLVLMAGDAAFWTEKTPNDELIGEATRVLKTVFGDVVPAPAEAIVTRWGQDEFSRGSYSYTGPDFQPDDYEVMARNIGNLFFGGEHTCGTHPATVHGAYISGLRAASEVLEAIIGPIEVPVPLIPPKESASKRKASAVEEQKDPKQTRLEAYEIEIWNAIYAKLGDRPWKPPKNHANAYQLYSKDTWEQAKRKCEEGRRPGKGKPITNEVKKMISKMWNEAPEDIKKPYVEKAHERKEAYAAAVADYTVKAAKWDKDAWDFRLEYEREHPSLPGPDEEIGSPWRRDRRAKRLTSGYAEDSGSELEL